MRISNHLFLTFTLALTTLFVWGFALFQGYFNNGVVEKAEISKLNVQLEKEKFHNALLHHQMLDLQQSVAASLPKDIQSKVNISTYKMNNLASGVREPASIHPLDLSGVRFERAKKQFAAKKYESAIKEFRSMLEDFPLSAHAVEAHFFIAESYFLKRDFKSSLEAIDEMLNQYPDHDLTGFILLRMGQINEYNSQAEEAIEIYKTVAKNFKNVELRKQAEMLAGSVNTR